MTFLLHRHRQPVVTYVPYFYIEGVQQTIYNGRVPLDIAARMALIYLVRSRLT